LQEDAIGQRFEVPTIDFHAVPRHHGLRCPAVQAIGQTGAMETDDTAGADERGADAPGDVPGDTAEPALPPPTVRSEPPVRPIGGTTEPDAPVLVGVAFDEALMAQEFLLAMSRLRANESLKLKDAVIVTKAPDGSVKVTETIDPTPGRSALSGAVWTGLLGLLVGGPVGWLAGIGIGAGAGAVTAKLVDLGIPDDWVDWFKQAVRPGTSAVVILAEEVDLRALQREAERFPGAELVESTLPDAAIADLAAAFEAH